MWDGAGGGLEELNGGDVMGSGPIWNNARPRFEAGTRGQQGR